MAKIEISYTEINGLLYPNIETGLENIESSLNKYGILRFRYQHEHKQALYRELLFTGKLAEHCNGINRTAFDLSERIRAAYIEGHPLPDEDIVERTRISISAQEIADEIVLIEFIYC